MKHIWIWITFLSVFSVSLIASAQDSVTEEGQLVIQPLFEYPVAPEEIDSLSLKCDWLMEHFWDQMDFKKTKTVDQNALNHAFGVYISALEYANIKKGDESIDKLISQISKNPSLSLQFAKAAEENLYGPRAGRIMSWYDPIFVKFLNNVVKNKNIKKERKVKYERLSKIISGTMTGQMPPEFDYKTPEGKISRYHPNGVITIIEFGSSDCIDCRLAKLKMDTDVQFSTLVDKGKINVLYIDTNPKEGWEEELKSYPSNWYVGASDAVPDLYDLRRNPSIYVIDREGKVAAKNIDVVTAMAIACAAAEN